MIRLRIGGLSLSMDDGALLDLVAQQGPKWLAPADGVALSPDEQTLRISMKATMRMALWFIGRQMRHDGVPDEYLPHAPKGADILTYGMAYFAWLLAAQADMFEYVAEYVEGPDGNVAITGVGARTRLLDAPERGTQAGGGRTALPDAAPDRTTQGGDAEGLAV